MSKKMLWSDATELRGVVATQNAVLLKSVCELVKANASHFETNTEDKKYVFGVLDILNKNTRELKEVSDRLDASVGSRIKGTKKDNVVTRDQVNFLSYLTTLHKYGEVVALTGGELIIELASRLKLADNKDIQDAVDTMGNYLEETKQDGSN